MATINVEIPGKLRDRFKSVCSLECVTMRDRIRSLVLQEVETSEAQGVRIWFEEWVRQGGDPAKAQEQCRRAAANASAFTLPEARHILERPIKGGRGK